jgi:Fe-S cluster biogenesis protein NfuA
MERKKTQTTPTHNSNRIQILRFIKGKPQVYVMEEEVKKALEKVRPMLQADGGDVEYVGFEDGVVKVRLKGACHGCPMSQMTLQHGIERFLKKEVADVKKVESIQ